MSVDSSSEMGFCATCAIGRIAGDVRRGLVLVRTKAPFRDHENSFTGHVLPM